MTMSLLAPDAEEARDGASARQRAFVQAIYHAHFTVSDRMVYDTSDPPAS